MCRCSAILVGNSDFPNVCPWRFAYAPLPKLTMHMKLRKINETIHYALFLCLALSRSGNTLAATRIPAVSQTRAWQSRQPIPTSDADSFIAYGNSPTKQVGQNCDTEPPSHVPVFEQEPVENCPLTVPNAGVSTTSVQIRGNKSREWRIESHKFPIEVPGPAHALRVVRVLLAIGRIVMNTPLMSAEISHLFRHCSEHGSKSLTCCDIDQMGIPVWMVSHPGAEQNGACARYLWDSIQARMHTCVLVRTNNRINRSLLFQRGH